MALIEQLPAGDAASAAARALEQLLGHDVMLTVGEPAIGAPTPSQLPAGATRSIALPFGNGVAGEVTLVVSNQFAASLEAAASDGSLVSAAVTALQAAAAPIEPIIELEVVLDYAGEIATETLLTSVNGAFVTTPILEDDELVASIIVRIVEEEPAAFVAPAPAAPAAAAPAPAPATAPSAEMPAPLAVAAGAPSHQDAAASAPSNDITQHEFLPLGDGMAPGGPARPLTLLNDVKMEVIAELGRRQMKVRDLAGLEPGSVIELDRAAGSPVDVLVNGALLAHGEVVVIDEEFGIRVSEIIVGDS